MPSVRVAISRLQAGVVSRNRRMNHFPFFSRWRYGLRCSIRRGIARRWWKTGRRRCPGIDLAPNGTNRKQRCGTMACDEISITDACYLCNTVPKTRSRRSFGAVPLLRVQKPSVIVMLRRRGASRGRPVLGGSLKSLAFMRECPKARSG